MELLNQAAHPVYWLGGSFSGGKTTTCRLLAERFDLRPYHYDHDLLTDDVFAESRVIDAKWFWLPVEAKVERYKKAFHIAYQRVLSMAETAPVIAEGPGLLPQMLAERGVRQENVLFLLSTPAHQRVANNRRRATWRRDPLAGVEDRDAAWERWMALDDQFVCYLSDSAAEAGFSVIWNDGSKDPDEVMRQAARHFGLVQRL